MISKQRMEFLEHSYQGMDTKLNGKNFGEIGEIITKLIEMNSEEAFALGCRFAVYNNEQHEEFLVAIEQILANTMLTTRDVKLREMMDYFRTQIFNMIGGNRYNEIIDKFKKEKDALSGI